MIQRKHNDSPLCYILGDSQQLLLNPITYLEEDACGGAADTLVKISLTAPKVRMVVGFNYVVTPDLYWVRVYQYNPSHGMCYASQIIVLV